MNGVVIGYKYLRQSPVFVQFEYESIDFNDRIFDDGVIKYKVHWSPTRFTPNQLASYGKAIECLLDWYENDIVHKEYILGGMIVHWHSTYEPGHQFLAP